MTRWEWINWPGRCHECGSTKAEAWNENLRLAECSECHHVCNHRPKEVLAGLLLFDGLDGAGTLEP